MRRAFYLCAGVALATAVGLSAEAKNQKEKDVTVDCAKDSLQAAVDDAFGPSVIFVTGTCFEEVTITTDEVTLSGQSLRRGM